MLIFWSLHIIKLSTTYYRWKVGGMYYFSIVIRICSTVSGCAVPSCHIVMDYFLGTAFQLLHWGAFQVMASSSSSVQHSLSLYFPLLVKMMASWLGQIGVKQLSAMLVELGATQVDSFCLWHGEFLCGLWFL